MADTHICGRKHKILRNLLLGENNELHNRSMHISGLLKADIGSRKADIEDGKANIESEKANIGKLLCNIDESVKNKTMEHIIALYEQYGKNKVFGRSDVEKTTGLKATRASEIIKLLLENRAIQTVQGHGKGKYKFKQEAQ